MELVFKDAWSDIKLWIFFKDVCSEVEIMDLLFKDVWSDIDIMDHFLRMPGAILKLWISF